jgi:hypothetical protein
MEKKVLVPEEKCLDCHFFIKTKHGFYICMFGLRPTVIDNKVYCNVYFDAGGETNARKEIKKILAKRAKNKNKKEIKNGKEIDTKSA